MSVLSRYLATAGQPEIFEDTAGFDEFAAADGSVRTGWSSMLDGLSQLAESDLSRTQRVVRRLLEDDGVSYTPSAATADELTMRQPWRLDPVPLLLDEREWASLEVGLVQRAELLNAVLDDLYGERRLMSSGILPAAAVFAHRDYLRPALGIESTTARRLFMGAVDLGRDASGEWRILSDRTESPSGAGFAMQNRRVISRAVPELYQQAKLHRLTPFFHAMRLALADAAPRQVEDPRIVLLSSGTHSPSAFDQAFLASLLGFPLLEGNDLTVRDGKVWMRVLGKLEQVDVILRRVDSTWSDPLELRAGSQLGVAGLLEAVRQGTVSVVNGLGSGVLENPALQAFLPAICQRLLGEPLRLGSVETFWCGDDAARSHVLARLDQLVIRPIDGSEGRSVLGSTLSLDQRDQLARRIEARPHYFVGQEVLPLSSAPTASGDRLVPAPVMMRSFTVRRSGSYLAMSGGLARVADYPRIGSGSAQAEAALTKDVWVISSTDLAPAGASWLLDGPAVQSRGSEFAMVPRVLSDLFWFGRHAERAEDLLRLMLATQRVAMDADFSSRDSASALQVLLQAVTEVSTTYPGFSGGYPVVLTELRAMVLDRQRLGTVGQSLSALTMAAQGVRDQLSDDVWMVLAGIERATGKLAIGPEDSWSLLTDTNEQVLSGLLGMAGITSENMVRDPGRYLLDLGRGLERALQVLSLLRCTVGEKRGADIDRTVIEAVLTASESIVTFRRRYRGRAQADSVVDLLVFDSQNPRSVAYQLQRIRVDLRALPTAQDTDRPLRILDDALDCLHRGDSGAGLGDFLNRLHDQLLTLGDALTESYLRQAPVPRPMSSTAGMLS